MIMTKYVAFLRGINVGGRTIRMKELAELFSDLGFQHVKTLLASGNVILETEEKSEAEISLVIQEAITKKFGFSVHVQLRTIAHIKKLVQHNPFSQLTPNTTTHWYVTFLPTGTTQLPKVDSDFFRFVALQDGALCSTLDREKGKTTDFMTQLDRLFGKEVTTRNWNTVLKISKEDL